MVRIEATCADGTPFPVELAAADDAECTWYLDLEHAPRPLTTLAEAVRGAGLGGAEAAWAEVGVSLPAVLRRPPPRAHGFMYRVAYEEGVEPAEVALGAEQLRALARRSGGSWGFWQEWCVPQLSRDVARLESAPTDAPFVEVAAVCEHALALTGVASLLTRHDFAAVAASCAPVFGERSVLVAHQLAQGSASRTTDAEDAIARVVRLRGDGASPAAIESAVAAALAEFGGRAVTWSIDAPTLAERPDLLRAQIEALARAGTDIGPSGRERAMARRDRLADEVRAASSPEDRAAFDRRLARLAQFVPIREARAHWQLLAHGALRGAVRRRAEDLVGEGVLDRVDDVHHLTPAEYDDPTASDLRARIEARRTDHGRWLEVVPPRTIGRPPDPAAARVPTMTGTGRAGEGGGELRDQARRLVGVGGSPGRVRGVARVVVDLEDADRLHEGEILVARGTSPPWTPLFAIVAAVVTDSGDLVSHVSIAAREHGIPCVAGAHDATRLIADGDVITVDGDAGVVLLGD